MKRSKTDQLGIGQLILLQSRSDKIICPVRSLQCWLSDLVRRSRPLFQHESGLLWIQYQFGAVIWKLLVVVGFSSHKYSMHSLRIGAVSNAAVLGFSPWSCKGWVTGDPRLTSLMFVQFMVLMFNLFQIAVPDLLCHRW